MVLVIISKSTPRLTSRARNLMLTRDGNRASQTLGPPWQCTEDDATLQIRNFVAKFLRSRKIDVLCTISISGI